MGVGGPDFPKVEILYYITKEGSMGLKVGLLWRDTPFHTIVNTLYRKTVLQATWIKFARAGTHGFHIRNEEHKLSAFEYLKFPHESVRGSVTIALFKICVFVKIL